jgi:hypothetical protein
MGVELLGGLAFLDALVRIAVVALARGVHKTGIYDAAFEHLAEGVEELASAFAAFGFKALLEVPERFGVRDEVLLLVTADISALPKHPHIDFYNGLTSGLLKPARKLQRARPNLLVMSANRH